ncbi:ATP-dependent RNA helicase [Angomonas deanei]|uniref:Helicase conserved C-terminal domain/Helicase associated domain (HA2)/Oligonucleotide/oligosaccharide-binding (OB)-fold, putative n=1 Tax=Angomonas deanei TaxID=59799 RepID=A0A7G2CI71_9TRYP|nr:ATP-dependent RNA helicase [Angomonas deanei]CAD2217932.1 Helicase conserved C-terminal domain/Helicase associated domain (HA2)/Oligonucleotide/oligosaccharide-binding (OB)-fold, putative [Angomonas deanei]|eukprot:EPY42092.1 ATP-dependent RNA helicase [Angomonas deanei]
MHVLPLYALLDTRKQKEVFNPPPKGKRLCVVSTNVAETSITIPNIRYVVDCGRVKNKTMDKLTQASCYKIEWTSQASAEQRSGRAGRVGPGHCYRLYSTAVYSNVMSPHSVPEILRTPLESVVLLMKHIGIEQVGGFPFPSPPMEEDIKNALIHLKTIGGLTDGTFSITPLGERMLAYPVLPRFARAIVECQDKKWLHILHMVVAIVAMASTCSTPFTAEGNQVKYSKSSEAEKDPRRGKVRSLLCPGSDLITNFRAFGKYLADQRKSCHEYCLVQKSMKEAKMLFYQLCSLAAQDRSTDDEIPDTVDTTEQSSSAPPADSLSSITQTDELSVRKIFIPGLIDQIARRATPQECIAYKVSYNEKKTSSAPYLILSTRAIAFIHPTSSVSHTLPPPEYVLFSHLQTVSRSESKTAQTHMLGVTIVVKEWLLEAGCEDY